MSGSGKGVSGVVGISRNGSGAGTFPDRKPTFKEEACALQNTLFESEGVYSDSNDATGEIEDDVPTTTPLPIASTTPMPTPLPSSQSPSHSPIPIPQRPIRQRHAPQRFDPDIFGSHGCHQDFIMNAYENNMNRISPDDYDCPSGDPPLTNFDEVLEFIHDEAHLANEVIQSDPDLPDAPSLQEALARPECDQWHSAILEELATIKEAGTWELVEHTPAIQNVIGCRFVLQK